MDILSTFIFENLLAVGLLLLCLIVLFVYEGRKGGAKLSPGQATRMINKEMALVIDLRSSNEFSSGNIAGSINIEPEKVEQHLSSLKHAKDNPVILVCKTGNNSKRVGGSLLKLGYQNVNTINGGMMTWLGTGMPLSK